MKPKPWVIVALKTTVVVLIGVIVVVFALFIRELESRVHNLERLEVKRHLVTPTPTPTVEPTATPSPTLVPVRRVSTPTPTK